MALLARVTPLHDSVRGDITFVLVTLRFGLLFTLAVLLLPGAAHAQGPQCTFNVTNISFGTVDLQKGNAYDAAGTFNYACTGDSREIIRICSSWGIEKDGTRWLTDSAGNRISYNLYIDSDRTTVWGTWWDKNIKGASIDVPLGRSERTMGSINIYGRIAPSQQSTRGGAYKSAVVDHATVDYGYAKQGSCNDLRTRGQRVLRVGPVVSATVRGEGAQAPPGAITAPDATKPSSAATSSSAQVTSGEAESKKSVLQKLMENAQYQQEQQRKQTASSDAESNSSQAAQQDRAKYIETHACMTTDGADKANELADECNKVTSGPHKGCNIQENTCEEIRKTTQKGCWGLGASAPDFCFTKYK